MDDKDKETDEGVEDNSKDVVDTAEDATQAVQQRVSNVSSPSLHFFIRHWTAPP